VLLIALLGIRTALALDPERHISEIGDRSWSSKDGAHTNVSSIAQSIDGFLWLANSRGLYRFDGTLFQSFEPLGGPQLPSRRIRSLFASPDGALWIGFRQGGVSALEAGRLTNYTSAEGFPEGFVNGFARDRSGRIWAASSTGLACFEGGRWRTVSRHSNYPGLGAQAVFVDHLGALWVATEHHIAVLSPGASKFELTDEPYNGEVNSLAESADGAVWMAETTRAVRPLLRPGQSIPFHGLSKADCQTLFPDSWDKEPRCRRPDDLEVRVGSQAILFDRDGGLWITTLGDGLRRAPYPLRLRKEPIGEFGSAVEQYTSNDGLSADYVRGILEDREGNIWVSTRDGIDQFRDSDLAPINLGSNVGSVSIAAADDGYIFALDQSHHLFRLRDSQDKALVRLVGARDMYSVYRDALGSIWTTDDETDSACRLVGDRCVDRIAFPAKSIDVEARFAMDARNRLWTYLGGLFVRNHGRWNSVPSGLSAQAGFAPATQFTDASEHIWFGFNNGQLLTVNEERVRTYSVNDGLAVGKVESIYSRGAHVWVDGERGLARLSGLRFTAVVPFDLPAFDGVTGVVEADDGSLWLNEFRGVVYISAAEVKRTLASAAYRAHYELLNSLDGLPGDTE
jgi:ligand-binding sensor domain-containing protein